MIKAITSYADVLSTIFDRDPGPYLKPEYCYSTQWKAKDNLLTTTIEVPGFGPENITVSKIKDKLLILFKKDEAIEKTYVLPIQTDKVTARVKNGLLTLTLEKLTQDQPIIIPVEG